MTIAVVYHSAHHGNTKKVLDAVAGKFDVELVNADEGVRDLSEYDIVGLASGIYYSKFHESVMDFAKDPSIRGKDVFLLFTSGMSKESYADGIRSALEPMGVNIIGTFHCLGLDTFGHAARCGVDRQLSRNIEGPARLNGLGIRPHGFGGLR